MVSGGGGRGGRRGELGVGGSRGLACSERELRKLASIGRRREDEQATAQGLRGVKCGKSCQ